jgi:hypothetical protein
MMSFFIVLSQMVCEAIAVVTSSSRVLVRSVTNFPKFEPLLQQRHHFLCPNDEPTVVVQSGGPLLRPSEQQCGARRFCI